LTRQDANYKGSRYIVLTNRSYLWTFDDPVSCAAYAKKNSLINMPGWKQFKHFVDYESMIETIVNKAKTQTYKPTIKYMYSFIIPNSHIEAVMLDKQHHNNAWQDAATL
jgi:predicted secreted acid phosphatase